jgi:NitT/TauT family transport system substrate-binding protein
MFSYLSAILALAPALVFAQANKSDSLTGLAADTELVETRTEVPKLKAPAAYEVKDNTIVVELSEYAGYAGLIVANHGMQPSDDSIITKKCGVKVKLTLSEEESWGSLNSGKIAASATTADVLAVYGRQFQVVVPAQISYSRGADGIVVRSNIKRINSLAGQVLSCSQFTESDFLIRYLADEAGLLVNMLPDLKTRPDPDKVNLVYCADGFGAGDIFARDLKAGRSRLAGCVTWDPKTSEVAEGSNGQAHILTTNRNLLVIADILIVNKEFAQQNPKVVAALVDGLLEGNRMVRDNPNANLETVGKAFKWDNDKTKRELGKVHLSNLPENLSFFSGAIDTAGSFGGIYQSAVYSYGNLIKNPVDSDHFVDLQYLKALDASGDFKDQKVAIAPLSANPTAAAAPAVVEGDPLLSKDIRFFFQPNSSMLDLSNQDNIKNLDSIKQLLQVSPGSTVLLRGHVDNAMIATFRKQGGEELVRKMALAADKLSKDRASEIKRLLIEKNNADPARLEVVGIGWREPAGTDSNKNRRVEVQWYTLE